MPTMTNYDDTARIAARATENPRRPGNKGLWYCQLTRVPVFQYFTYT